MAVSAITTPTTRTAYGYAARAYHARTSAILLHGTHTTHRRYNCTHEHERVDATMRGSCSVVVVQRTDGSVGNAMQTKYGMQLYHLLAINKMSNIKMVLPSDGQYAIYAMR